MLILANSGPDRHWADGSGTKDKATDSRSNPTDQEHQHQHERTEDHESSRATDNTNSIIPSNVFARLYLFFNVKVDCCIMPEILEDLVSRKDYSLDLILEHLRDFQQSHGKREGDQLKDRTLSGRMFVFLVGNVFDGRLSTLVSATNLDSLASLVTDSKDSFEELLSDLCRNEYCSCRNRMLVLTKCLEKINAGQSHALPTINLRLSSGETPVKLAVRFRSEAVLRLLLRHGASIHNRWLCFNSAFEVLLFSPHQIYTSPEQQMKILRCLEVLLRASNHVQIAKGVKAQRSELVPFIKGWRSFIPDDYVTSPCSLKQLCRLLIRRELHIHKKLPEAIASLPLPTMLKEYLDLLWS